MMGKVAEQSLRFGSLDPDNARLAVKAMRHKIKAARAQRDEAEESIKNGLEALNALKTFCYQEGWDVE